MNSPILHILKTERICFIMLKEREDDALANFTRSMDTCIWIDGLPAASQKLANQIVTSELISRLDQEMLVTLIVHAVERSDDHRFSVQLRAITRSDEDDFVAVFSLDDHDVAYGFLYIPGTTEEDFAAIYTIDPSNGVH